MVQPIYIMAAVTTAVAVLCVGGFLWWRAPREERGWLVWLLVLDLPMCALAFCLVRMPLLDGLVRHVVDEQSGLYHFLTTFYAPLTEEPAKLWPLLVPALRRRVSRENCWRAALALGLGFGVGELWFIAHIVAMQPRFAALPWYAFTGFLNERFMVCILHGAFVSLTLFFFARGKFLVGFGLAMLAHFAGNFPIYLMGIDFGHLGAGTWGAIVGLYVPMCLAAGVLMMAYMAMGKAALKKFLVGRSVCPECGTEYRPPVIAINLMTKRLERCPGCRKWHLVSRLSAVEKKEG